MSMTPAFSPGPWITQGALVGSVRRWIFEDLYEQCSFHMAEKMPSSVKLGSRPIRLTRRSYSSGLSPCSATSCGVIGGSLRVMADPVKHALGDGNGAKDSQRPTAGLGSLHRRPALDRTGPAEPD